jgi:ADP-ribosylglycohydrolase
VTDDTQLTIATCEAIIEQKRVDPESIADRFVEWFRARRITGIGSSTLKALTELEAGGHWALVGATGERSAGNGGAMRIAPLAFFLNPDNMEQRQTIRDVCRITHRNDETYIGALAILRTIRHVAAGKELARDYLKTLADALPDSRVRDRFLNVYADSLALNDYAQRFGTTGFVADSVPAAILAAMDSSDLVAMIREIVNCGGDTDTIASMASQILGASRGPEILPMTMLDRTDVADLLCETAVQLCRVASHQN